MIKCFICLVAASCFATASQAQTKWIAHRSHSGLDANFSIEGADNFGLPRNMDAKWKKQKKQDDSAYLRMDTMIKLAADTVIKSCVPPLPKKNSTKAKKQKTLSS